jgi:hypothetical protein
VCINKTEISVYFQNPVVCFTKYNRECLLMISEFFICLIHCILIFDIMVILYFCTAFNDVTKEGLSDI